MCQHLCVWDNQVIGYWGMRRKHGKLPELWKMRLEMDMDSSIFLWKFRSRLGGAGRGKGGSGSLVNTALVLILLLPDPLWARPDECKPYTHILSDVTLK